MTSKEEIAEKVAEKAAAEATKQSAELFAKVAALVNAIADDLKSFFETKFRRDVIMLALQAAQSNRNVALDADAVCRYALAVADKLAPESREKQVIKPSDVGDVRQGLGYKLTDDEAREVAEASK